MVLESGNKDIETKPDEGFFAYLREIRNSFKKFVSDIFSTKKEISSQLDDLKGDVSGSVDERKGAGEVESSNRDDGSKSVDKKIDSAEENTKGLRDKLKEICVRSRKYGDVNKNDNGFVSFGKLQFHGDKSKKIMRNIKSAIPSKFDSIMTDPLFKNIDKACTSKRNDTQVMQFKKINGGS